MHKQLVSIFFFLVIVTCYAKSVHKSKKYEETKEQYYNPAEFDVIYDRKQLNASENVRVDVQGVNVIVAPPSSILQAFMFAPLSLLSLLDGFSKRSLVPILKKNLGNKREGNVEINEIIIEATTGSTSTTSAGPKSVVEEQKTPVKDFTKNFEEKIQVKELLPGAKEKDEETKISAEESKKPEIPSLKFKLLK